MPLKSSNYLEKMGKYAKVRFECVEHRKTGKMVMPVLELFIVQIPRILKCIVLPLQCIVWKQEGAGSKDVA